MNTFFMIKGRERGELTFAQSLFATVLCGAKERDSLFLAKSTTTRDLFFDVSSVISLAFLDIRCSKKKLVKKKR